MINYRVAKYIEKEQLLVPTDKVLVAVSGGADSVALLCTLLSLGYSCEVAHCNFHLRGEESNRDEQFVIHLCNTLQVPIHVISFETDTYAREHKISIEMAARELRYQWFPELSKEYGYTAIAVAHHQDDSVETMLLNLIRGTGINGLLGIRPKNGMIVRPLLCVTRDEIIDYLKFIEQDYIIDSTNLQDDFTRNKIRLKLIPLMQEINPSVKDRLLHTGTYLNQVANIYQQAIDAGKERVLTSEGISIAALLAEPSPEALLFELLSPLGFNSLQIENMMQSVLNGQSGKQFISNNHWRIVRDREFILITQINEASITPPFTLHIDEKPYTSDFNIVKEKHTAFFDAEKLKDTLTTRKWKQGDTFVPFGMTGKKLVSDFLTDNKLSLLEKENQWVLCCGDKIAWVIGQRTDNRFRIDPSTRKVIIITLQFPPTFHEQFSL